MNNKQIMNKLLSLSVMPLAATATFAAIAFSSAPVQALSLDGELDITGSFTFDDQGALGGNDDTFTFDTSQVVNTSTGDFATWSILGNLSSLTLADVANNSLNLPTIPGVRQAYNATTTNPFITFTNGITFTANNPFDAVATRVSTNTSFVIGSFTGTFNDNTGNVIGRGSFSGNNLAGNSYSLSITPVPEPLTILGTGLALGFGGLFKVKKTKK